MAFSNRTALAALAFSACALSPFAANSQSNQGPAPSATVSSHAPVILAQVTPTTRQTMAEQGPGGVFAVLAQRFPDGVQGVPNELAREATGVKAMKSQLSALTTALGYAQSPDRQTCDDLASTYNNGLHAIDPVIKMSRNPAILQVGLNQDPVLPGGKTIAQGYGDARKEISKKCPGAKLE